MTAVPTPSSTLLGTPSRAVTDDAPGRPAEGKG